MGRFSRLPYCLEPKFAFKLHYPAGLYLDDRRGAKVGQAKGAQLEAIMLKARIVLGQGDDELDYGVFEFVTLPRTGENVLVALDEGLIPLSVAEVFHHPVRSDQAGPALVVIRVEKR